MPIIGPQVAEIRPLIDCMSDPSEWRNLMGNTNGASLVKDSIRKYKHLASQPSSRTAGTKALTRIKVVGLGDSGCKWVHRMYSRDLAGVEYVMVNTEVRRPKEGVGLVDVVKIEPEAIDSWGTGWYPEVAELALGESDLQLAVPSRARSWSCLPGVWEAVQQQELRPTSVPRPRRWVLL